MLQLRNPHSIHEVLTYRPHDIVGFVEGTDERIVLREAWDRTFQFARQSGVSPLRAANDEPKGPVFIVRERQWLRPKDLFSAGKDKHERSNIFVLLDGVEDPKNIGAIVRSCAFFGVAGVLITGDPAHLLVGEVYDVAGGGMEHVPYAFVSDLEEVFAFAKATGLVTIGTDSEAAYNLKAIGSDCSCLLVLGNEERGVSPKSKLACELICRIPSLGMKTCLNVGVAAGIFLSHLTMNKW